jgi:hypothetical protein
MIVEFFRPALSQTLSQLNGRRQNAFSVHEPHYPLVVPPPNSPIHGAFEEDEVMVEVNDQENDNNDQPPDENGIMIELSHCEMPFRQISLNCFQCLLCFKLSKRHCDVIKHLNSHKNCCAQCGRGFPGTKSASLKQHELFCQNKSKKPKLPKLPQPPKTPKTVYLCQYCQKAFQFNCRRNCHEAECQKNPK